MRELSSNAITKYKNAISKLIDSAFEQRSSSELELEKIKGKMKEIEETCAKLKNNAILEGKRLEELMKNEVIAYRKFKEKYIEEKIQIFTRVQTESLKSKVLNSALELITKYLKTNKTHTSFEFREISQVLAKEFNKEKNE